MVALYVGNYIRKYILNVSKPWIAEFLVRRPVDKSLLCNNGLHLNWHVSVVRQKIYVMTIHLGVETGVFGYN